VKDNRENSSLKLSLLCASSDKVCGVSVALEVSWNRVFMSTETGNHCGNRDYLLSAIFPADCSDVPGSESNMRSKRSWICEWFFRLGEVPDGESVEWDGQDGGVCFQNCSDSILRGEPKHVDRYACHTSILLAELARLYGEEGSKKCSISQQT
jgi:hypothetical protein